MSIKNFYLDAMFSTEYFAESAHIIGTRNNFNYISLDDDIVAEHEYGRIIGSSNKILIKQSDIIKFSIEEDMKISMDSKVNRIKNIIKNSDGTANLILED